MERTAVIKLAAALAAAAALVALGALLPRPPADPATGVLGQAQVLGQASLAPSDPVDSVVGRASLAQSDSVDPVVGRASLAPSGSVDPVVGRASLAPTDSVYPVLGQASLAPSGLLHVYVCGAVRRSGVYTFSAGARVVDAIARAGGAAENGDLEQLNLAEPLADAMKVDVPIKGQLLAAPLGFADAPNSVESQRSSTRHSARHRSSRNGSHKLAAGQTININTASESELAQLPGVGPSLARRIVEYRTANGAFQLPDDLQNVSGIGASKFAKMEPYIRV